MSFFSVDGLMMRFGGLTALDNVSFEVDRGMNLVKSMQLLGETVLENPQRSIASVVFINRRLGKSPLRVRASPDVRLTT